MPENWCFQTVVLEKTLESPLDCKEIKPIHPKGNQPWVFIGRTDAKVEAPILWSPNAKSQFIGKDPDSRKDWRQEKGMTEDEMVEWHHRLKGHELEQTGRYWRTGKPGVCSSWAPGVRHDWATEQKHKSCWLLNPFKILTVKSFKFSEPLKF